MLTRRACSLTPSQDAGKRVERSWRSDRLVLVLALVMVLAGSHEAAAQSTQTRTVEFEASSYSVSEALFGGPRQAFLVVHTSDGSPTTTAVSVAYASLDGTAVAGSDYAAISGLVTFPAGVANNAITSFNIGPIIDDLEQEPDEVFSIVLSSPTGATLGPRSSVPVTIRVSDTPQTITVSFTEAATVTSETAGNSLQVWAHLLTSNGPIDNPVTVDYASVSGTATAGSDFIQRSGTLTWAAGTPSGGTWLAGLHSIIDDVEQEPDETFSIVLSNPVGASLGDPSVHVVTIQANDDTPTDPLLSQQWHLKARAAEPGSANVQPAWSTTRGEGVVIGIIDDGLQHAHPDLAPNFVSSLSHDFRDGDNDPSPTSSDPHGTSVAGIAAARGDNFIGVSGVAPLSGLAGLRITYGAMSDVQIATALSWELGGIHIGSNSWGPYDDGRQMWGPGTIGTVAIENAIRSGRNGKGRVFLWAAGNGRANGDNCNYDGFATLRYSMAIGALTDARTVAYYSEPCSALFVVAPSGGGSRGLTTTDLMGSAGYSTSDYMFDFAGTSGSTPIVAGVSALMLARNPSLTWRDVQHIIRQTSSRTGLAASGWTPGLYPHHEDYGFGQVDAAAAVAAAATWVNVPAEEAIPATTHSVERSIPDHSVSGITDSITVASSYSSFTVEHVEVEFTASHPFRGDVDVILVSPSGVESHLAPSRPLDSSVSGFSAWRFMSVRHWGEPASGEWALRVSDRISGLVGVWKSWTLKIYGTTRPPTVLTSLTADHEAPQPVGTTITFTAVAEGGTAPYQYKWWLFDGSWHVLREWAADATFAWTPVAAFGGYRVGVWVRSATSTADASDNDNANGSIAFPITSGAPPLTVPSLTADKPSPQAPGTTITWTASTVGGTTPYAYKWRVYNGASWSVLADWGPSATVAWTPGAAGTYQVNVWARSAGNTVDAPEAERTVAFTISVPTPGPLLLTSLTADHTAPQPVGTTIVFTAAATGGTAPYQYKWWLFDGSWRILRSWTPEATLTWTPTVAFGGYKVGVWVRSATSTADASDNDASNGSLVFPITVGVPPLTVTSLTADKASPQVPGTTITWTAGATGGTTPYAYKWRVSDGTSWSVLADWGPSATVAWTPGVVGTYQVNVWVRSAGNTADAAEAERTVAFTISVVAPPPLTVSSLTADKASPQAPGTTITFTAVAAGGTTPYAYKWRVYNGATWSVLADWGPSATVAWTPGAAGTYQVNVWARSAGNVVDAAEAERTVVFTISVPTPGPLLLTSLTADHTAPQPVGTTIVFTAAATGGTAPYQYKWWLFDGSWRILRSWTPEATLTWTPTVAFGGYKVGVWVRSATSSADASDNDASNGSLVFPITVGVPPLTVTSLTADKASPQVPGTTITFTAVATGGTTPYAYQWRVSDGTSWSVLADWGPSATVAWTPGAAGTYQVSVWARSAGNTVDAPEAERTVAYVISVPTPGPLQLTSLTADHTAPQPVGTTIVLTAAATGGTAPYQYKWWLFDGSWRILRSWTPEATLTWTPTVAFGGYKVGVWVRSATSTADASDNDNSNSSIPFPITVGVPPLTVTSLTADKTSPQVPGTTITFTAAAVGGTTPYAFKWRVSDGASWSVLADWGASATATWTPGVVGTYQVSVWARSAGNTADAPEAERTVAFTISVVAPPPLTVPSLTADKTSPQAPGTTITWTASAVGGTTPYAYKWRVYNGTSWSVLADWSPSATVAWTPGAAGTYQVNVWARSAGNTVDAPEGERTVAYVISVPTPGPLLLTSLTADHTAPQPVGTTIVFTAAATGGTAPYQYKWWLFDGSWRILRSWTTDATYTWTPTVAFGGYKVGVWVRSATSSADASDNDASNGSLAFPITVGVPPLTVPSLTADKASPQVPGTTVTFTAGATGGTTPYAYKWRVSDGTSWSVLADWGASATVAWTPGVVGAYQVSVWARSAGNTADAAEAERTVAFTISVVAPPPLTVSSLTADKASPQAPGTTITFTAVAAGGTTPYAFKWRVYNGTSWSVLADWGPSATVAWTPGTAGTYQMNVWARSTGNTVDAPEAERTVAFTISVPTPGPLLLTSLTADHTAPQPVGTTIVFTAAATGGTAPYQYKWWVFDSSWRILRDWTSSATHTWTPTVAFGGYKVGVWVRSATSTADASDNDNSNGSIAFPIVPVVPGPH